MGKTSCVVIPKCGEIAEGHNMSPSHSGVKILLVVLLESTGIMLIKYLTFGGKTLHTHGKNAAGIDGVRCWDFYVQ